MHALPSICLGGAARTAVPGLSSLYDVFRTLPVEEGIAAGIREAGGSRCTATSRMLVVVV